jgi:L-lactate dehydrogenase (cytochrome)
MSNKILMDKYPSISDLEKKAQSRIPKVSWLYLQSGTGRNISTTKNRSRFDQFSLLPSFIKGKLDPDFKTNLFGRTYNVPFGVAPVGLTGLIWPRSEFILAKSADKYKFPYSLSTVATQTPESVGKHVGDMGWFQLYPPKDPIVRKDILNRAKESGFHTLIITADVPTPGRREESIKSGMSLPVKFTPKIIWDGITHPVWTVKTLTEGLPNLKTVGKYAGSKNMKVAAEFARFKFRGDLDWDYIKEVKGLWDGPVILKGILHPQDAIKAKEIGIDGICVSNHGGRQFDGAPAAIDALPEIAKAIGNDMTIIFDSGITSSLDIIKALALGADFVLLGKAFMYGCAALGDKGGDHVTDILIEDLKNNMIQLGVESIDEIKNLDIKQY